MSRWPDAGSQLERALVRSAADAGIRLTIHTALAIPWASVTFTGARHRITIAAAPSPALSAWLAKLPETEFRLRGHLVADLMTAGEVAAGELIEITLEALTVEDC